ncbi:uncharacterized protein LOC116268162 [Nymphaea colorata]|uniref:uncharacterized protein LOC116268162 n=1 Tax=Nymphaea colorata TaxID=210225 RepID=UPI00129E7FCA|nr:uncharacterized protein LOC116268162 [Nymphaea colorata]
MEFLLRFVPETVAPNLITLVAFAIIVVSHFVFMFWGENDYSKPAEPWKLALFGITLFVYQHLDNLDGKQARKTIREGDSELGHLDQLLRTCSLHHDSKLRRDLDSVRHRSFPPGCDKPNRRGSSLLPVDRPLGFLLDYSFWQEQHIIAPYNYEFLLFFLLVVVLVCWKMTRNVMKETKRESRDMYNALAMPVVLIVVVAAVKFSGLSQYVYGEHFYAYLYIWVCFWGRNEIHMQICSVASQKFKVFNWSTIFFLASMAIPILIPAVRAHLSAYLYVCLAIQFIFMIELFISFLRQAASILNIRLFRINPPPAEAKTQ